MDAQAGENRMPAPDVSSSEELREAIWPRSRPDPVRVVRCRHCGRRNRVQVPLAVMEPERHECGACGGALFLGKEEPLTDLSAEAYQHSLDRRSVAALRSIPGVTRLIQWALEAVGDRTSRMLFMADAVQCSDEQFPELVQLAERARIRLGLRFEPTVYLGESPYVNAMTTGVKTPVIVVHSALLDQMRDEEVLAVLGHELGHLHAGHPLYQGVANMLLYAGATAASLAVLPIQRVLRRWLRHAELTCDRAALLASRDLQACVRTMLTFAGGNRPGVYRRTKIRLGPFVRQCREFALLQNGRTIDRLLASYMNVDRTHPNVAARVVELIRWVEFGNYLNILSGEYARLRPPRRAPVLAARNESVPSLPAASLAS